MSDVSDEWVTLCRRTNDPKLRCIEQALGEAGIRSRRAGGSFHAPILEVRRFDEDESWCVLINSIEDLDRALVQTLTPEVVEDMVDRLGGDTSFDDVPDDDPAFEPWRE